MNATEVHGFSSVCCVTEVRGCPRYDKQHSLKHTENPYDFLFSGEALIFPGIFLTKKLELLFELIIPLYLFVVNF